MAAKERLVLEDEEGVEIVLPTKYEVCSGCDGKGKHDHPAFSNGITADEWNGPDWDDDSREGYLSGRYDVTCEVCDGLRVELVADEDRMTPEVKALWEAHVEAEVADARERASELRWGY